MPGYEAPVYVSWARTNRSALIRVPAIRGGHTGRHPHRAALPGPVLQPLPRLRGRCWRPASTASSNELPLPEPVEENLYHFTDEDLKRRNIPTLPATLGEAVQEMSNDDVVRAALGDHVFERLIEAQTSEWDEFRRHVSPWERDRYLEVY